MQHPGRMKKHMLMLGWLVGTLFVPMVAPAAETPLGGQMETVGGAVKGLRADLEADKGAAIAREAQDAVLRAAAMVPATVAKLTDEAAKARAGAEYRLMMGRLFVTLCEVEQAYLAKDSAKLATLLTELKAHKKAGHTRFMDQD